MQEEDSQLKELQKNLYSRKNPPSFRDIREPISRSPYDAPHQWEGEAGGAVARESHGRRSLLRKVLIGALLFFIVSAGFALYTFYGGLNVISADNVSIDVIGPITVAGGEEFTFEVALANNNTVPLENTTLVINFPEGTRDPTRLKEEMPRYREVLGSVASGEIFHRTVKAVIYGEEDSAKEIIITLEYNVKGSTASFFKDKKFEVILGTAPVRVSADFLKEVVTGQPITIRLEISSNTTLPLERIVGRGEYPFGFTFKNAEPAALFDKSVWHITRLNPGEKKLFIISGTMEGQEGEERVFRFTVGRGSEEDERVIETPLTRVTESLVVKRPFVGVAI